MQDHGRKGNNHCLLMTEMMVQLLFITKKYFFTFDIIRNRIYLNIRAIGSMVFVHANALDNTSISKFNKYIYIAVVYFTNMATHFMIAFIDI